MIIRVRSNKGTKKLEVPNDCTVEGLHQAIVNSDDLQIDGNMEFELSTEFPGMNKDAKFLKDSSKSLSDVGLKHGDLCYIVHTSSFQDQGHSLRPDESISASDDNNDKCGEMPSSSCSSVSKETLPTEKQQEKEERGAPETSWRNNLHGDVVDRNSSIAYDDYVRPPEQTKTMNLVGDDLQELVRGDADLARRMNSGIMDDLGQPTRVPRQFHAGIEGTIGGLQQFFRDSYGEMLSNADEDDTEDDVQRAIQMSMFNGQDNGKSFIYILPFSSLLTLSSVHTKYISLHFNRSWERDFN